MKARDGIVPPTTLWRCTLYMHLAASYLAITILEKLAAAFEGHTVRTEIYSVNGLCVTRSGFLEVS